MKLSYKQAVAIEKFYEVYAEPSMTENNHYLVTIADNKKFLSMLPYWSQCGEKYGYNSLDVSRAVNNLLQEKGINSTEVKSVLNLRKIDDECQVEFS